MNCMTRKLSLIAAAGAVAASGCSSLSKTENGALIGGGVGSVAGTVIGAATGNPRTGAAIGAGVGALTGGAIGHAEEKKDNEAKVQQAVATERAAQQQARLGLSDVVTLVQQNVDADVIINQIRSTGSTFQLSTGDIQYLTNSGVPPRVIRAMQEARGGPVTVVQAPRPIIVQDGPVIVERPYYYRPYYPSYGVAVRFR